MAKQPTKQQQKNMITTDLNRRLYDYNNETTGYSSQDITDFISGRTGMASTAPAAPDYMGGVNPVGNFYDYSATRYDGDIYSHDLENLDNIRAQNQGVASALGNATANFLSKTAVNVAGGLTGFIYGAGSAIANRDWSQLWDNDVTTALDNATDSIGEYFKVYKSSDYQDKFILNKMFSNPLMFTDEFMDTLSFTAGAVVTELLSSGLATSSLLPKASQYMNRLSRSAKSVDAAIDAASIAGNINSAANLASATNGIAKAAKLSRQLATGAFWEASVEARHLGKELRDNMVNDYLEDLADQGIQANEDSIPEAVMQDIEDRVKNASAVTMALNTGLVGFSNLAQFPSIFKTYGNAKKGVGKNITSELVDGAERYTTTLAAATPTQRSLQKTWAALKNPFMEGFVEEGGQGVISGTMGSFYDRKNDIEGVSATERFLEAFSESFIDTYTTKEGLNEVLMGALIGGVGSPGAGALSVLGKDNAVGKYGFERTTDAEGNESFTRKTVWDGGVVGGLREFNQEQTEAAQFADFLNNSPDLVKALKTNFDAQIRSYSLNKDLDDAIDNNDHFEYQNSKDNILFNFVNSRLDLGMRGDIDFKINELRNMSPEEFSVTFKGEEETNRTSREEQQEFQKESIDNFVKNVEAVSNAKNSVETLFEDLISVEGIGPTLEDMTYYLAKSQQMANRESSIYSRMSKLSSNRIQQPNPNSNTVTEAIRNLKRSIKENSDNDYYKEQLSRLESFEKKYGGKLRSTLAHNVITFEEQNPTEFRAAETEIDNMLKDLPKIEDYKNSLVSLYNKLNNPTSMLRYQEYLNNLDQVRNDEATNTEESLTASNNQRAEDAEVQASQDKATQATTNTTPKYTIEDLQSNPDLAYEISQRYQQTEDLTDEETDLLDTAEGIVESNDTTLENTPIEESNTNSTFDDYLSQVPNLLDILIPQAFLRSFQGQVDFVKKSYTAYRNSKSNLADIGTPRDIADYQRYRDNVFSRSFTVDNEGNPVDDVIENTKVDNVDAETIEDIQDTIVEVVTETGEQIELDNTASIVKSNNNLISLNKNYSFKINNGIEYYTKKGNEVTNIKRISSLASLLYKNKAIFKTIIDEYFTSNTQKELNDYFERGLALFNNNTINDDSYLGSPELLVSELLLGVKFLETGIKDNLSDIGSRWFGKAENGIRSLDNFVINELYPNRDNYGLSNLDEQDITNFVLDIIDNNPKGLTKKSLSDLRNSLDPNKELEDLRTEFLNRFGLNFEEVTDYIANEKTTEIKRSSIFEEIEQEFTENNSENIDTRSALDVEISDVINTQKVVEDEILVQKQVDNSNNMKEIPVDLSYTPPTLLETEEFLDDYRGVSLTNIHARKQGSSQGFNYQRNSDGKYEILDTYPKAALLPNIGVPGSTIQVKIPTSDEYFKYTGKLDYDALFSNSETIPLAAYQNNQFIGFILTPRGAQSSSKGKITSEDLNRLKSFRNHAYANQGNTYELNVKDKTMGVVTYRKNSNGRSIYRPISEHLSKDGKRLADDVHIVVDVNGILHSHKGYEFDGDLINASYGSGHIYTLVPLANGKHVKIPVQMSKIDSNDANTVLTILKYFTAHNRNQNDAGYIQLRNELNASTGINLNNINEFYSHLGNIIYINNKGVNQFFNRERNEDGSFDFIIKSPAGMEFRFGQYDLHNPAMNQAFTDFIQANFYRGVKVEMMNTSSYQHLSLADNGDLKSDQYNNYIDYVMESNILQTDVYGEPIDTNSNRMSFVLAPFIKVRYPSIGNYTFNEGSQISNQIDQIPDAIGTNTRTTNDSFLDDVVTDDFDINFSMLDLKNESDNIISPDIETEINNFIKFCK